MNISRTCDRCGAVVPTSAPQNLCLRCLFDSAVDPDAGTSGAEAAASLKAAEQTTPPPTFGDYELLGELGRGGQGVVYRARHRSLGRVVALKTIPPAHLAGAHARERFRLEASTASRLDHPNIVPIYEVGERDGFCFYSMKLVEGTTIQQLVPGSEPDAAACRHIAAILVKVANAVHHAHQRGVLHRDLKPSNVLLDQEHEPHVSDFGLARQTDEDSSLTLSQALIGTPAYLAPEVATGGARQATVAADIYGLGAILYQLLAGRPPFAGATIAETLRAVQDSEPARPHGLNPAVPADLETICLKCLEKEPAKRYGTAQALADDLGRYLNDEPIEARPVGPAGKAWRWCRRKPALASSLGVVLCLILVLGFGGPVAAYRINLERRKAEAQSYTSDINLVLQAWEEGNLKRAQDRLRAHIPKAGERDLRGFEWRYLWRLCQDQSRFAFTNFTDGVSLALSPDAEVVAACSGHVIKLLDLVGDRELAVLTDPEDMITASAFSPTGTNVLATGTDHGTIKLWNLATKQLLGTLSGHTNSIYSLAFSTDGTLLACITETTLTLWDVETRTSLWTRTTAWWAGALVFAPDEKSLVTGGGEAGNPILWDVATGNSLPFPGEQKGFVNCAAFSPDGKTLATGGNDSAIILWDFAIRTRRGTLVGHRGPVEGVRFSPDGRYLVSGSSDATLRLWDVASMQETAILRGHQEGVISVAFAPDSGSLLSSSWDRTIRVWDTEPKQAVITLQGHKPWPHSPLFSPDGQRLISVDINDRFTRVWDVASQRSIATLDRPAGVPTDLPVGAAFSPNGEWLAIGSTDHTVRLWNAKTLELRHLLTNDYEAGALSFSPDSRVLAVAQFGLGFETAKVPKSLTFWKLDSFQRINKLAAAAPHAARVAFAHRGRLIAVGYSDGTVGLWDFSTETLVKEFKQHRGLVFHLAFSSDDTLLASCSGDDVVLYDVRGRRAFPPLKDHAGRVLSVAFAPDDKTLASTSYDGTVKLWNVATRQAALTLIGHAGPITQATFAPDGKLMAATGADGTVRLWPAPSLQEIQNVEASRPPKN